MKKEVINVAGGKRPTKSDGSAIVSLSQATKAGGFVFCSGMYPLDMDTGKMIFADIQVQTHQCIKNLELV